MKKKNKPEGRERENNSWRVRTQREKSKRKVWENISIEDERKEVDKYKREIERYGINRIIGIIIKRRKKRIKKQWTE